MSVFKRRFYGKWVLSGEYSVLRSFPALVYPISHYFIDFHYKKTNTDLHIKRQGKHQTGLDFSISPLFDKALLLVDKKRKDLKGSLTINGFVPFGTGLGASSILCLGIAHLFSQMNWIPDHQIKEFSISLEDLFHEKSSGMDITVVLEKRAILYKLGEKPTFLPKFLVKPNLFLSYSGGRSPTSFGVSKVTTFVEKNKVQAEKIDKDMGQSVEICLSAIKEKDKEKSKNQLIQALSLAEQCFHKWNLFSYDLEKHARYLKKHGALATKPTGSGLGGHVISLWDQQPPSSIKKDLLPLDV